jgi:uncharacterized membrane protein
MRGRRGGLVLGVLGMIYVAGLVLYLWKLFLVIFILLLIHQIYTQSRKQRPVQHRGPRNTSQAQYSNRR